MESASVVEDLDKLKDLSAGLGAGGKLASINQFEFEGAPKGLHGCVVVAVSFAAHGSQSAMLMQSLAKLGAGILRASIRMEYQLAGGWAAS